MSALTKFYAHQGARKWFLLALLFACLFLVLSALYASGAWNTATLEFERWLIGRPLTQFDCVLVEWRNFGSAPFNLIFVALVGIVCGLTRYRWRVLIYLLILVLVGIAIEEIGKSSSPSLFPLECIQVWLLLPARKKDNPNYNISNLGLECGGWRLLHQ